MEQLRLSFLGDPLIKRNGATVKLGLKKALGMLSLLGVTLRPYSRDALAEFFFPRQGRGRGRAGIRQCLTVIRGAIGNEWLNTGQEMVSINERPGLWVDVKELRDLEASFKNSNQAGGYAEKRETLERIEGLFRGDFLAGFSLKDASEFDLWQTTFEETLKADRMQNLQRLAALHLDEGEYEDAILTARRLLTIEATDETAHRALMISYALLGRRAEALRQFEKYRSLISEELGVEPEEETEELRSRIASGDIRGPKDARTPAGEAPRSPSTALPPLPTPFIGRNREIAIVLEMLGRPSLRLLTITGMPGTGKTRLAQEAARRLAEDFPDGVFFDDLLQLVEAADVVLSIARLFGFGDVQRYGSSPFDVVSDFLKDKKLLLVLDNFEHVLDASESIARLLGRCPHLTILATSRELLHLHAENEFLLLPLAQPSPSGGLTELQENESVRFFVERARASHYGFTLTESNAGSIAAICIRLGGLPLALELAAARIGSLPPDKLRSLLETHGSRLLGETVRDMPARHQTLWRAIEWSYDLATPLEKAIFRRLAAFAGGCTLEAAEAVCRLEDDDDVLAGIQGLVEKNLVSQTDRGGDTWYAMLETIREFAAERLDESGEANRTYRLLAHYYLELVERAEPEMDRSEGPLWVSRLEHEFSNIRTAVNWSIKNEVETALRVASALERFAGNESYWEEDCLWLQLALSVCEESHFVGLDRLRARALSSLCVLNLEPDKVAFATRVGEKSIALWRKVGDARGLARALTVTAMGHMCEALSPEGILSYLREGAGLQRSVGDHMGLAHTLFWYSYVTFCDGRLDDARSLAEEDLQVSRQAGDVIRAGGSIGLLGQIAAEEGDYEAAQAFLEESLSIYRDTEDRPGLFHQLSSLGALAILRGDYAQVHVHFQETYERKCVPVGVRQVIAAMSSGYVDWHQGRPESALASFKSVVERLRGRESSWSRQCIAHCLAGVAAIELHRGRVRRAAQILGGALPIVQVPYPRLAWGWYVGVTQTMLRVETEAIEAEARCAAGAQYTEFAAQGRALPLTQLVGMALATTP